MKYYAVFILSSLSLVIERIWNGFWDSILIVILFLSLAILKIPQNLPETLNIILISAVISSFTWRFLTGLKNTPSLSLHEIRRKIEKISNLKHRPLDAIKDCPLQNNAEISNLWEKHVAAAKNSLKLIRSYTPKIMVAKKDIYYLRYSIPIFFIAALAITPYSNWAVNIKSGFIPKIEVSLNILGKGILELWVESPSYTNKQAEFIISSKHELLNNTEIKVVEGSILKARSSGYIFPSYIMYGRKFYKLPSLEKDKELLSININKDEEIILISNLINFRKWKIKVVKDTAPEITITNITPSASYSTKLEYNVNEDFGIKEIDAYFKLKDATKNNITYKFPINYDNQTASQVHLEDLTSNPWAGKEVDFFIKTKDTVNQISESKTLTFTLPERQFKNTIARRIIEARKTIAQETFFDNKELKQEVAENLAEIAIHPHLYKWDIVSFMALNSAIRRIITYKDNSNETMQLLWDIAVQLEDGGVTSSQKKLYQALQKLQTAATQQNLSNAEKQDLVKEVQQAVSEYLQSLAKEMQDMLKQGKTLPSIPSKLADKLSKGIDIEKFLEKMQEMSETNSYKDLADMAKNLRNNIDNFDINKIDEMQKNTAEAMEALNKLDAITKRQQELLDKTNNTKERESIKSLSKDQSILKNELAEVTKKLSSILPKLPQGLASAYNDMSNSVDSLEKTFSKSAALHQEAALKSLQQALDEATDKIAESLQNSLMSFGFMPEGGNYGKNYDPLGRNLNDENIKIPGQSEGRMIKKIIEELRRRSNDFKRKEQEREYLERLIN